jgi:Acyl-CoA dehydrogenase, N-terminal domain
METAAHGYEAVEYDLSLTAEQLQIRDTARRFAAEVLRPVGIEIDRMTPEAVIARGSPLYKVLTQAAELGFTKLRTPAAFGGLEAAPATAHMVLPAGRSRLLPARHSTIEYRVPGPPRSTSAADSLPRAGAAGLFDDRQRTALDGGGAEQLQPHWRRWHSISDVTFYTWAEQVRRVGGLGDAR